MPEKNDKMIETSVCPHCNKENKVILWPHVHTEENPRIAKKIVEDTFFDKRCEHCGEIYYLNYSLIYRDDDYNGVICYASDKESEMCFLEALETTKEEFTEGECFCTVRVVKSRDSLREKARIFKMGYDDRIVEMFKVWGLEYLRENGIKEEIERVLCWVDDDGSLEITFFCRFEKGEDETDAYVLVMSEDQYIEAEEDLLDYLEELEEKLFEEDKDEFYVDFDWAMNFIAENNL